MAWLGNVSLLCVLHLVAGGSYLLPLDVVPSHYDVKLTYDVDPATNFSFYGLVDILVTAKKATTKIVLHSEDHEIDEQQVRLSGSPGKPCVTGVEREDTYSLLTLTLDRPLEAGENYTLTIPFRGNLKMGLDGAYVSSYYNTKTKQKEYLITTQFEATSARKGFPCFDEPMFKSTFKITIGHCKEYTAVSNMPLARSSQDNPLEVFWPWNIMAENFKKQKSDFVWDEFDVSVPMSTYLIAYVVSKFEYVESPAGLSTTKFRIWARSDALDQTEYAARIGPTVLTHFEKWFNVSFPLPKQDMMAIPDFAAGAMENWGLITYRETALLYHKEQSSFLNKERVAEVIAHELAHQWFGNLVTMKWWSDLWLNEGFATFAASVGVAAAEPAWRAHRSYAVDNTLAVLSLDALETSHPVSVPIDDPKRISEIFDEISYRKGSTLIRMMTMFLGEEVFRKAIHNYLVKYSYQNAEQDDLWRELTAASEQHGILPRDITVKDIMDTWTTQTGYPVLTVSRDYTDGSLTITQKRYVSLGARAATVASWWVPLSVVALGEAPAPLQWLAPNEGLARPQRYTHPAGKDDWLLLNHDMIAPYRVSYDARNWQLLAAALQSRAAQLPPLGRVQLLADAFALAWTNQLDYNTTLQLASYLSHETEYLPLSTGLKALAKIENTLKRSPEYGAFQKFIRKMIGNAYQNSGGLATKNIIQGDDLESVKMQVMLSGWACRMKVPGCEENAMELYEQWMETENPDENNPIPLELRRSVYCTALSRGGVRHWRWALARRARAAPAARDTLLHALACSRDVWVLAQYLEWAVSDTSEVRRQDSASVISGVIQSTVGYYIGKEFVYERIADIHKAMNGQGRRLGSIVKVLLNQFTTQRELDQFLDWSKTNSKYLEGSKLSVDQAIENAKVNIDWITRNKKTVVAKLREYST